MQSEQTDALIKPHTHFFSLLFKLYKVQKVIKWLNRSIVYKDLTIIDKIYKLKIIFPYIG